MKDIGLHLKELREKKNLSIEKVAAETRMKSYIIEEIEKEDFAGNDVQGYGRIMLYTYAKFLGADADAVINEYDKRYSVKNVVREISSFGEGEKKLMIPHHFIYISLIVAFALILALILFNFHKKGMLESPFKKENIIEKKENREKIKSRKAQIKSKILNANIAVIEGKKEPEKNKKEKITENKIVRDDTDYVEELLFKNNNSVFNVKDN
ncbi:MAG: hypothetical protein CSB55_05150 [Candidatus Cloacimonadota bacterium]|nr:MAG: hypothetical protein CSB55_05150 [Candidatus Cloacimonadota bacterium]